MMEDTNPALPRLNLPLARMRVRKTADGLQVFDPLRDKFVALTPEEYVRQQFTAWLRTEFGFPAPFMANEIGVTFNGTSRRCDTVIFGRDKNPKVIVEYKAPNVRITQTVFDQIVRYNHVLHADYLVVSNGMETFCCRMDYQANTYHFIPRLPDYRSLHFSVGEN